MPRTIWSGAISFGLVTSLNQGVSGGPCSKVAPLSTETRASGRIASSDRVARSGTMR
ncbi:hypothetical protein JCM4814A_79620 [Streptomyces phaeofaciens JCM 4814]|uniref:Uncharacterized protein n=1 Tax=Streptomyces phaeofaciens TaxID=68254 RepID=A0A918M0L8_9ACTN|nr:hypothetical protein GCM10010226_83020 [Streptomyces phaeofaciens]